MLRKLALGLMVALAACAGARVIERTQAGGTIELQGDHGKAMEQADEQMTAHCGPKNFIIVREGEEPVGTHTQDAEQTNVGTATAWRVHYACGSAGSPPPAGATPPPGGAPPAPGGATL